MTLRLPTIAKSSLELPSIDWSKRTRRFMNPGELEALLALVASVAPKVVIEIGVNEGRTAKAMMQYIPTIERYLGIDVQPGYIPACKVQAQEVPERPGWMAADDARFKLTLARRGSLDLVIGDLPACDAIFIDGDHGRDAVMHDTDLAFAAVRKGGIVIWHDYHDLGIVDVRDVLHRLADNGAPIQHVAGTWLAFMRV
jgi:predicted O-methyltransferase YrrM